MAERYHKVRVQFPSGKTFERECFRFDEDEAARTAVWVSYMDHMEYNPGTPARPNTSRLPAGWGDMSEEQKFAIATQAGYKALAVASYVDQVLTWRTLAI